MYAPVECDSLSGVSLINDEGKRKEGKKGRRQRKSQDSSALENDIDRKREYDVCVCVRVCVCLALEAEQVAGRAR